MGNDERHGVLVGWSSQDLGSNVMIDLQTFDRASWGERDRPDHTRILMTRSQATVLANHLLKVSGALPPPRKRWLASLLG
jgi:hypothetical protein